jgi:pilus assembly protein CpaB
MKKILPIILAGIVFIATWAMLRPAPASVVVVAAYDLRAGHVLQDADLALRSVSKDALPSDVITEKTMLIGQPLRIDRGQGDVIRASQIGNLIQLEAGERAIAVRIVDATGVAGLLVPGQMVGVVASIPQQDAISSSTFSKAVIEGLRVLHIDPRFSANSEANTVPQATPDSALGGLNTEERAREGSVLLAVPTGLQVVFYDFTASGAISQSRSVNALELLAALSGTDGAVITLYLMPQEGVTQFSSPGLWLPDLVVRPQPTPTPTLAPTDVYGNPILITPSP